MAIEVERSLPFNLTKVRLREIGISLIFFAFIAGQFFEISLFQIGSFDVSLQKVLAFIVFPISILFIGEIRISKYLIIFGIALFFVNSVYYFFTYDLFNPDLINANTSLLLNLLSSILLYTALVDGKDHPNSFEKYWIFFSIFTSIVCILQALDIFPLWLVPKDILINRQTGFGNLIRATGFKYDPNYQAFFLVIGFIFARFSIRNFKFKLITLITMFLGILATFSRMGIIVAISVLVIASFLETTMEKGFNLPRYTKIIIIGGLVLLLAFGVYQVIPADLRLYLNKRLTDFIDAYYALINNDLGSNQALNSAEARIFIALSSIKIIDNNLLYGVGALRVPTVIYQETGILKTAHDTYLDLTLTGGIWGIFAIAIYGILVLRSIVVSIRRKIGSTRLLEVITLVIAFGIMGFFLTFNNLAILWLPLILSLALPKLNVKNRPVKG